MLIILKFTLYFGSAADRLNIDLTLPPNYKVKTFYSKLAHPAPRWCQLNSPLPWPRIYAGLSTNWEAEIAWRIAHGVLNSRQSFLLSLGISDHCAVCRNTETFSHAFCKFSLVPTVWNWVLTHTNKLYLLNAPSLPLKHGLPTGPQQVGSDALITRFPFISR